MPLRPIFYDTETTGIKAERDRVIELAAYDPLKKKSFVQLINPECPIPLEASNIHHITDDMVASEPTFDKISANFVEFCQGDTVLIAHNNDGFDIHFLRNEFKRCNKEMPEWTFLDSLKWARRYRPDLPRHSLQFLREVYGFPANNAHRALDDVIILQKVFEAMVDDLSMETILQLMSQNKNVSRMPFGKHQGKALDTIPKEYVSWLAKSGAFDKPGNEELKESFQKIGFIK
jgi:DNA polymerase III subunit epsilon